MGGKRGKEGGGPFTCQPYSQFPPLSSSIPWTDNRATAPARTRAREIADAVEGKEDMEKGRGRGKRGGEKGEDKK